jgi:asparagine synthase (glutamine-hydrolysing)
MTSSNAGLLTGYIVGDPAKPDLARGDFVVGNPQRNDGWAESSSIGASPWYYTVTSNGELVQGANVFELCAAASMDWEWNTTAISQIALVGHTLGQHTLHRRIFRLPAHARLSVVGGRVALDSVDPLSGWRWDSSELDESFGTLTDAFDACLPNSQEPILSLSAGFDSRVLLALCLRAGCSPRIVSMGSSDATDVRVARILAQRVGLPLEQIALSSSDYLANGERISRVTSGVKTSGDWHTWLYNSQISAPDRVHLVGSNGEFARTFYSDVLTRSRPFALSGHTGVATWLRLKALNRLRKLPRALWRGGPVRLRLVLDSLRVSRDEYPQRALPCLDTFYAIERVHHFIGSGIACYAQFGKPRSPFLDKRWMKEIAALRRPWKQQNRYHLAVIRKHAPSLLDVPFNRDPDGRAPTSYSPFAALSKDKEVEELIVESRPLDALLNRGARVAALRDVQASRTDAVSFLLTMHFACVNAQTAYKSQKM